MITTASSQASLFSQTQCVWRYNQYAWQCTVRLALWYWCVISPPTHPRAHCFHALPHGVLRQRSGGCWQQAKHDSLLHSTYKSNDSRARLSNTFTKRTQLISLDYNIFTPSLCRRATPNSDQIKRNFLLVWHTRSVHTLSCSNVTRLVLESMPLLAVHVIIIRPLWNWNKHFDMIAIPMTIFF